MARNRIRVLRGPQFSQMTDEEREAIIRRGRKLAQAGRFPATVTSQLSRESGRSAETIRYTLRYFDQTHPDEVIFPGYCGPLQDETKRKIYHPCGGGVRFRPRQQVQLDSGRARIGTCRR